MNTANQVETPAIQESDVTPVENAPPDNVPGEPEVLFHLATDAPLRPAAGLTGDFPAQVSDLPAFYYWKDAIAVGSYVHPAGRFSLNITRDRLDGFVSNFARMRNNGVGVPILMDHSATASSTLGWIVDVRRDGDQLLELHQFLGESARDVGLRNKVSLGIDPHFVDGKGNQYGEAIVHSAVTPTPVVPEQGEFIRCGLGVLPTEQAAQPHMTERVELSLKSAAAPAQPVEVTAPALPVNSAQSAIQLDMNLALSALEQVAIAKRDLALSRGGVDSATAAELFNLLVKPIDGSTNLLMLSRTATGLPIALAVFDALARNRPVPFGETTGVQVLTRNVPGEDGSLAELRERMIALASGR
jgi:hypothetical protein